MDIGLALGRELGLDDDTINAIADWRATDRLSPVEKLVAEYADVLTGTPVQVSDQLRERLSAEFSEKQIVELTNFIAWENARARFNRGFNIEAEGYG